MAPFTIPPDGVVLRHKPKKEPQNKHQPDPAQVFRVDLLDSVARDVLRSLKNNDQVRLRCGKRPTVVFGKKSIPLDCSVDSHSSEIFSISANDDGPLYFTGRSSHRLEVRRAEEDTAKADEALATLENTLKSIQQERAINETSLKEDTNSSAKKGMKPSPMLGQGPALRKEHFLGGLNRSTPGSPFLGTSYSPRLGPTSAPLASGTSAKDRIRLDAIRIPLVHLLAVRPMTLKSICTQLQANKDDIEKLIDKVSWESKVEEGKRELKEKLYRELDVWKFPYQSQSDRQAAIDHSIQAFDRTRVEKKDPLWQLLLPVEERGKGKILSKLNFDKPAPSLPASKPSDEGLESKQDSDRDHAKIKAKKDKDAAVTEKSRKDKANSSKPVAKGDTVAKVAPKSTKAESKYKSADTIIDSDEEAAAADVVLAKPKKPEPSSISHGKVKPEHDHLKSTKANNSPLHTASPKKTAHKSSLSSVSSSSSNNSGSERPRPAAATASKSLKPQSTSQHTEGSGSRISPRPRHDSSPQKPSPLGSSPPTTSTDLDNSNSSKASNQSSAPSSPPSGTDMPQTRAGNKYSPIISDKSRNVSRGRSPVKRKIAAAEDERPAKRQQRPQSQQDSRPNSTQPKPTTNGTFEHPALKRPSAPIRTDSERSSSPEKPGPKRDDIIEEARRFQKYYKRYKDLHDRINQMDEKDRDDKDMADLWKMHKRLKEMKADIWQNWDKVDKVDKVETGGTGRGLLAVS
jgi:RNA polymerase II elongation factor ELL